MSEARRTGFHEQIAELRQSIAALSATVTELIPTVLQGMEPLR